MAARTYLTPREIVAEPDLLAGMALDDFYAGIKPGGALHRLGFPDPVPWAAGRKKKWDRHAVAAWQAEVRAACIAHESMRPRRSALDEAGARILEFPLGSGAMAVFRRLAEQRAAG